MSHRLCDGRAQPATLSGERYEDTATGGHIKHLVKLRRWAKPLQLAEERLTFHVLESDKPAAALVDYATMNDVDHVILGAPREASPARLFPGVCAQVAGAGAVHGHGRAAHAP
jgi:hypothetical protein